MGRLENKIAIVTGAADGIGLGISQVFAKEGAIVIMSDVNIDKCKKEAEAINNNSGKAIARKCDVGSTGDVVDLVNFTLEKYNRIDVLVNNAALGIAINIMEMPEEEWDRLMNVNLKSVFRTVKSCLPHMIKQGSGSIINISSAQAHRSWDNYTAYAGAKGAMISMTMQMAGQFSDKGVRFNTISPGAILTPMNEARIVKEGEAFLRASKEMSPMGRMGTVNEIAMSALFLASDEASFITGEDLNVDGGLCAVPRYIE